jgi:DNA-binding NtrC family response regulator
MPVAKVLVIDDDQDVREIIAIHLEGKIYQTLEAENGEDAIEILRSEDHMDNIGLILCDIRMPKVNGIDFLEYIMRETPDIPVVVITGYPDNEMEAHLIKQGAKDYLIKPVEKKKLLDTVEQFIACGDEVAF